MAADFERLGVCNELIEGISEQGWFLPTAVQDEAIPLILGGGDVCVAAETGSGKTGAFALPCLQLVKEYLNQPEDQVDDYENNNQDSSSWTIDSKDKEPCIKVTENTITNEVIVQSLSNNSTAWNGCRANRGIVSGIFMFEIRMETKVFCRVGWGTFNSKYAIGTDELSYGYGSTGRKSWNNVFDIYGEPFDMGDTIGCIINRHQQTISFAKNNKMFEIAFYISSKLHKAPLFPMICGKGGFCVTCKFHSPLTSLLSNILPVSLASQDQYMTQKTFLHSQPYIRSSENFPLCVILEPTRDLAIQTFQVIQTYSQCFSPPVKVALMIGGGYQNYQEKSSYQTDIVIGTLQMMYSNVKNKRLRLSSMRIFVLDEADNFLEDENQSKDIIWLKSNVKTHSVQVLLFSATLQTPKIRSIIDLLAPRATWIDLKDGGSKTLRIPETVHCVWYPVDPANVKISKKFLLSETSKPVITDNVHQRQSLVLNSNDAYSEKIKQLKPKIAVYIADYLKMKQCLIFCRSNLDCNNFEQFLNGLKGAKKFKEEETSGLGNPYSCVVLAGMRSQEERQSNFQFFKEGRVRFLICTDVAARGLDIKELPFVISMTLPDTTEQFLHRIGRVGRANTLGLAISIIATCREKVWYHKCANRGINCSNTKLVEQGGCCIWLDEPLLLRSIEQQLGHSLPILDPITLTAPGIIEAQCSPELDEVGRRRQQLQDNKKDITSVGSVVLYGKENSLKTFDNVAIQRLNEISCTVQKLNKLEDFAQLSYISLLYNGLA